MITDNMNFPNNTTIHKYNGQLYVKACPVCGSPIVYHCFHYERGGEVNTKWMLADEALEKLQQTETHYRKLALEYYNNWQDIKQQLSEM